MGVDPENKKIAKYIASIFAGKPSVQRHWDEGETTSVDLLAARDSPWEGVTSYSTVTLSDTPIVIDGAAFPGRVEIVGACGSDVRFYDSALVTAALCVARSQWAIHPEAIFPDCLAMYDASPTMKHLMFVPPFSWDPPPETLELESKKVLWLQAIPIAESEYQHAIDHGPDALEDLFVQHQIDVFDLMRPPVV